MRVTEDHRPPGADVVDVAAPVGPVEVGTLGAGHEDRRAADGAEGAHGAVHATRDDARRALESAKESKYSEIRDNETDYRTGKLSDEDYRALDRQLRAEAVEILRAIDELDASNPAVSD